MLLDNKGFDLWAEGYDKSVGISDDSGTYPFAGYKDLLSYVYNTVRSGNGKSILDIGTGTGILSAKLYNDGYSLTCLDFSEKMLGIAKAKMPDASFINHDFAFGLPTSLKDAKFDFTISTYAFHHLNDSQKISFISELKKILVPGGIIVIGDIAFSSKDELEKCKAASGTSWDNDEFYITADEFCKNVSDICFKKISFCSGVFIIK